jgi:hypothetical protein
VVCGHGLQIRAIGVSKLTKRKIKEANPYDWGNHRTNYVHKSDPLNRFQQNYGRKFGLEETGETIELNGDWWDGLLNGHFIDQMVDAIEDNDMDYFHIPYEEKDDDYEYEVSRSPRYF